MLSTVQIFVPTHDNAGNPAPADLIDTVAGVLCEVAGGATIHGIAEGFWQDPRTGAVQRELVRIVEATASGSELVAVAREAAQHVKDTLKQACVMVRWIDCRAEMV